MRAPEFWSRRGVVSALLWPASQVYRLAGLLRRARARPWRPPAPVICVGNLVAGGAGKTPTALAVGSALIDAGTRVHFLTRGYGGKIRALHRVDPEKDGFKNVGDEALLLARVAPTWVSPDRPAGARAACAAGAQVIVMDDGFQNPSLAKDLSLIVIDGGYGFGNGRLLPAGPLREPVEDGLERADGIVLVGDDRTGVRARVSGKPLLEARLVPTETAMALAGKRVVAFAGIGRPDKFFDTVREIGADLAEAVPFPDHHPYTPDDVMLVVDLASERGAVPVTTEKDFVRLPAEARPMVQVAPVQLEWRLPAQLHAMLDRIEDRKPSVNEISPPGPGDP